MSFLPKKELVVLVVGDLFVLLLSLWLSLFLRYSSFPSLDVFITNFIPFGLVIFLFIGSFFIAGLYENHTLLFRKTLPGRILNVEIAASLIAVILFYITPIFGLSPKTILLLFLVISFIFVSFWRLYVVSLFYGHHKIKALLVGRGKEFQELLHEVNSNDRYSIFFTEFIDLDSVGVGEHEHRLRHGLAISGTQYVVIDLADPTVTPMLSYLYRSVFNGIRVVDFSYMYETIFNRIPIHTLTYTRFFEGFSVDGTFFHDVFKRAMDIVLGVLLLVVSLPLYPFVALAIYFDDRGKFFIEQKRIGKGGKVFTIYKWRTMSVTSGGGANQITKVGKWLRVSRIDELPQLFSVIKGDLSLVGPRPELPDLVKIYEEEIPYYGIRHLVTPGLSGWAQIYQSDHPHYGAKIDETKTKLSYDLFYLKHRSFMLDLIIALKTVKTLLSRTGA